LYRYIRSDGYTWRNPLKYKQLDTAPLVIGGVYEKTMQNGLKQRVTVLCGAQATDGTWRGEATPLSDPPFEMVEGTETMAGWALVATPKELGEPVFSDDLTQSALKRVEKEKAILEQRVKALEKKAAADAVTAKDIATLIDKNNKSPGEVARMLGLHHSTVRKMYNDFKAEDQAE
jgi:hypothetical protein